MYSIWNLYGPSQIENLAKTIRERPNRLLYFTYRIIVGFVVKLGFLLYNQNGSKCTNNIGT